MENAEKNAAKLTEIVFVTDASGSMAGLESDTIGGINAVLDRNRKLEGEAIVSIVLFNTNTYAICDRMKLSEVKPISDKEYRVGGCTALLDAVGGAIRHTEQVQGYMPPEYKADEVVFVITTDGLENASRKYSYDQVKRAIERKQEEGWEFLFLGANIDVAAEAGRLGIKQENAAPFISDGIGSDIMFDSVANAVSSLRSEKCISPEWSAPVRTDVKNAGNRRSDSSSRQSNSRHPSKTNMRR